MIGGGAGRSSPISRSTCRARRSARSASPSTASIRAASAILHNLVKDSNGHLRIALNSSALGPGNYQFTIEGLTWRGETVPDAWVTIGIAK